MAEVNRIEINRLVPPLEVEIIKAARTLILALNANILTVETFVLVLI